MGHGFVRRGTALLPSGAADGPTVSATQSLSIEQERQAATLRRRFSAFGLRVAGCGLRVAGCGLRARARARARGRGGAAKARPGRRQRAFANTAGLCVAKTDAVGSRCAVLCNGVCQGAPVKHGGALRCAHPRRWLAADGVPRTFQTTGRTRRQPRSGTGRLRTAGLIRLQANPYQCLQGRPGGAAHPLGGSERSKRGGSTQPQAPCASAQPITAIGAPSGLMKVSGPRKVM